MEITFADFGLTKQLYSALEKQNIRIPTPIQERTFKPILSGKDIMGIAQTGTGKTLAYLLPLLNNYKYSKTDQPKIVILVPTRELVVQITETLENLTENINVRILGIYGGVNINNQKQLVHKGVDILVGTPGRVLDLSLDHVLSFRDTKKLVVDEFDEMLSLGFRSQLINLFTMINEKRQNLLFSATMTDQVDDMLNEYFKNPLEISLAPSGTPVEKIKQTAIQVRNFNTKLNLLVFQLEDKINFEKVLIFTNNKKQADIIFDYLDNIFPSELGVLHSNKSQNFRLKTIDSFKKGNLRGIITTDIMARGLDIPNVTHVINFEIPEIPEHYIHRIGRTGRADKNGNSISYFSENEADKVVAIEVLMNNEIKQVPFPNAVEINCEKRDFEKDIIKMKNLDQVKIVERGPAFHEKKDKNKKVNIGGHTKRKPPKTRSKNRGQQKQKAKNKKQN